MKYYLIKTPNFIDDCDISIWFQDETLQCPNEVVELTEQELKEIVYFFIGGINVKLWRKELADKIRKVLE